MSQIVPDAIEQYIEAHQTGFEDPVVDAVGREGRSEGLPLLHPASARLLRVLVHASGARRVLEIGTAIGYSALSMSRSLPQEGQLISIERDPARAARARTNFERAGVADRVSVIVGDASRYLHKVAGPFDLVFQDGAKSLYEPLLDRLVGLLRPGGLLVSDNVLWRGEVARNAQDSPEAGEADLLRSYNRRVAVDPRLLTVILPVGDGVSVSVKVREA